MAQLINKGPPSVANHARTSTTVVARAAETVGRRLKKKADILSRSTKGQPCVHAAVKDSGGQTSTFSAVPVENQVTPLVRSDPPLFFSFSLKSKSCPARIYRDRSTHERGANFISPHGRGIIDFLIILEQGKQRTVGCKNLCNSLL